MPDVGPVDRLYRESIAIIEGLEPQLSLKIAASDNLRKGLLMATASHFEHRLTTVVLDFVRESGGGSPLLEQFVRKTAIDQKYHTWFAWETGNANKFFSLFGPDFSARMKATVNTRDDLRASIAAFVELGNERNRLVHLDYATFPMDKTLEDIYAKYQQALLFVTEMPTHLRAVDPNGQAPAA